MGQDLLAEIHAGLIITGLEVELGNFAQDGQIIINQGFPLDQSPLFVDILFQKIPLVQPL